MKAPLFAFLKRASKPRGLTAVSLDADGFGLAHVSRADDGKPTLDACVYRTCADPDDLPRELIATVREMGLRGSDCVCVPKPGTYSVRQIERPMVQASEMREAARWAISDLIDFNAADAVIDTFEIPAAVARKEHQQRIYAVAARKPHVDAAVSLIRRAGLQLKAIDITELALRNVSGLLPEDERGIALLHLASDPGLLELSRSGALYLTRNIDSERDALESLSGHAIDDLKTELSEEGERVFEGFLLEVQRSLDYVEHQLGQSPVSTLVIAPLGFPIDALKAYMSQNLSIQVKELDVNDAIECREPLSQAAQAACLPAIGAALRLEVEA